MEESREGTVNIIILRRKMIQPASVQGKPGLPLLNCSHRKASDKPIQEKIVQDSNGHASNEAGGHQRTPEIDIAAYEKGGDPHAHGIVRHSRDKRKGVNEIMHQKSEGK